MKEETNKTPEGMKDWNKMNIDEYIKHLQDRFQVDSSGTAKAVFELIRAYKKAKQSKWVSVEKNNIKLKKGDVFLWESGMTGEREIHTFHSCAGYGAKTFTEYNEKDGSSLLVNYSGIIGLIKPLPTTAKQ